MLTTERSASSFSEALKSDRFVVTCELNPPKGVNLDALLEKAEMLKGTVQAINLTDSAASRMTMAPIAVAHLLRDRGIEPILQLTCRDRNRLALQSELLAACALGVGSFLCMSGDPPSGGDHPDAKPVFDLDAVALLRAAHMLEFGRDLAGNQLDGSPSIVAGAVVNPGAADLDLELRRMEEKVEAGASFFQTQATYDPPAFERFMERARGFGVPVLAGMIVLKSGSMARTVNYNLPGVSVPEAIVQELEAAESPPERTVEISARLIREIQPMCAGVHIMAIGWESRIPEIVRGAGLAA